MSANFAFTLLNWFDTHGRKNLPWQKDISPYRVWISEIMLQQTQVATVIPYFEKFMTAFPTVTLLAQADLDQVLHLWTGLGYYARARNIHKTAKIIVNEYDEFFPNEFDEMIKLPGIGRSTAGAILSIAFNTPFPILDGNVKRVLSRYHAIEGFTNDKDVIDKLWTLASEYTPTRRCGDYTQAIMDLGATVCTRSKPACEDCPVRLTCVAYGEDRTADFPQSRPRQKLPIRETQFLILQNEQNEILLEKRPLIGIWGGLWGFPEFKAQEIAQYCQQKFECEVVSHKIGDLLRHTFTHFHLDITPIYVNVKNMTQKVMDDLAIWCQPADLPKIGLPKPVLKLLSNVSD